MPVVVAPMGMQRGVHPEGERATRAGRCGRGRAHVPFQHLDVRPCRRRRRGRAVVAAAVRVARRGAHAQRRRAGRGVRGRRDRAQRRRRGHRPPRACVARRLRLSGRPGGPDLRRPLARGPARPDGPDAELAHARARRVADPPAARAQGHPLPADAALACEHGARGDRRLQSRRPPARRHAGAARGAARRGRGRGRPGRGAARQRRAPGHRRAGRARSRCQRGDGGPAGDLRSRGGRRGGCGPRAVAVARRDPARADAARLCRPGPSDPDHVLTGADW